MNRHRIFWVTPETLVTLFKEGDHSIRITDGLPADARAVRCFIDERHGCGVIGIVVESSEFDEEIAG